MTAMVAWPSWAEVEFWFVLLTVAGAAWWFWLGRKGAKGGKMAKWKCAYPIRPPIDEVVPHLGYPTLGIFLRVEDGKLIAIEHVVELPEGDSDPMRESYPLVRTVCEVLEFHWGLPAGIRIEADGATETRLT